MQLNPRTARPMTIANAGLSAHGTPIRIPTKTRSRWKSRRRSKAVCARRWATSKKMMIRPCQAELAVGLRVGNTGG